MLLDELVRKSIINPPTFLPSNTCYLCRMGSVVYGVSQNTSDVDIYGVCIPPRDYIFPPNYIEGFDNRDQTFHQWQQHHCLDQSAAGGKGITYDFSIYSIVNYFKLAMDNNPNVIDSLFVRREHVIHSTPAWENVREHRKLFLHKGAVHKLKGYGFSQLAKAKNCIQYLTTIHEFEEKNNIARSTTYEQAKQMGNSEYLALWEAGLNKTSRFENQKIMNGDYKFLYHVYRLVDQAEFILHNHDLDLQEEGRVAKMKAIRRGDLTYEEIVDGFHQAELRLTSLYESSALRKYPPVKDIRNLLLTTLESHYDSLAAFIKDSGRELECIKEIKTILGKFNF